MTRRNEPDGDGGRDRAPGLRAAVIGFFAVALCVASPAARGQSSHPGFTDVTAESGLNHVQRRTTSALGRILITGGVTVGDFDGDGYSDLFFTRHDDTDILYRNKGDGTFEDITTQVFGDNPINAPTNGALFVDLNNNGHLDLYVTSSNGTRNYLYMNDGNGRLVEQAVERGAEYQDLGPDPLAGMSVTAGDYNGDGLLDLYVTNWRHRDDSDLPPRNRLLRNDGDAYFTDVTTEAGLDGRRNRWGFGGRFADMNRNGHMDLLAVNDFRWSEYYENQGDGTFVASHQKYGTGIGFSEMGSSVADYNNNGWLDWFLTAITVSGGNRLYENRMHLGIDGVYFEERGRELGVHDGDWGWGGSFIDFDNNGLRDLVMVNGWEVPYANKPMRFWRNDGPDANPSFSFTEIGAELGLTDDGQGRGLVVADFDNDGFLDILIANHHGAPVLYRNDGAETSTNKWLRIDVIGEKSNRMGLGAWITVEPSVGEDFSYVHDVNLGSNFLSHSETTAHFGLGEFDGLLDVRIEWPSGETQTFEGIEPNQLLTIHEMNGIEGLSTVPAPGSLAVLGLGWLLVTRRSGVRRLSRQPR